MSWPPSASSSTTAFDLLHPGVQRWVYREGWTDLRDVQGEAILAIAPGGSDVLVSAPTASGKTEAAFLPLLSRALRDEKPSVRALYIGPLKALINDQFARLEGLCDELEIPVHRWHGDVSATAKARVRKDPGGVVLITPESLEALFVRHGSSISTMFAGLEGVVVDEAHAFIGSERGAQLQSLLHRLEAAIGRRIDRIGLSATLGEPRLAAEFLRPGGGDAVRLVESREGSGDLRALIVGFEETGKGEEAATALRAVADHLYKRMRGRNNLVFANSRKRVEELGDLLIQRCKEEGVPEEFGAHHGSLSKEIRLDAEERLKDGRPFTAVCTSTLEMGIDIGSMSSVGQVGVPPSVAALRQRVGRSGRRKGESPTLWMYAMEARLDQDSLVMDRLRVGLFQQMAMLELMVERWCEPPRDTALHLSTLVQQCLSAVAERGGMAPAALYRLLGQGPFARVDRTTFVEFLRDLGKSKVLVSAEDGTLLAGEVGERLLSHYSFYSAFATPEEFRIVCDGRTLGTLPIDHPVHPEGFLIFAARRWRVLSIDEDARVILVARAAAGKAPMFSGDRPFGTLAKIRKRMRALYEWKAIPPYLDAGAKRLMEQGRAAYAELGLRERRTLQEGSDTLLFLWDGDYAAITLALVLQRSGLEAQGDGLALSIEGSSPEEVGSVLERARSLDEWPSSADLAAGVSGTIGQKHDDCLGDALRAQDYAARVLDVASARVLALTLTRFEAADAKRWG